MPSIHNNNKLNDRISVSASSRGEHSKSRRTLSIASSVKESGFETLSHIAKSGKPKDDEWNAIVKFNTLLHYEE